MPVLAQCLRVTLIIVGVAILTGDTVVVSATVSVELLIYNGITHSSIFNELGEETLHIKVILHLTRRHRGIITIVRAIVVEIPFATAG